MAVGQALQETLEELLPKMPLIRGIIDALSLLDMLASFAQARSTTLASFHAYNALPMQLFCCLKRAITWESSDAQTLKLQARMQLVPGL